MKWYFASRVRHLHKITEITKYLESKGEIVLSHWIYENPPKPFNEHPEVIGTFASKVTTALSKIDIFVLISDPEGTDMFVELGFALARKLSDSPHLKIYIVGKHSKRSAMQLHPSIIHSKTLFEVFKKEGVDCGNLTVPDLS